MKFKGMPGLVVNDGKNKVEFPYNGILELKGNQAKWLKSLIDSGKLKGVKVIEQETEKQSSPKEGKKEGQSDKG
jgi:hypothetical protein